MAEEKPIIVIKKKGGHGGHHGGAWKVAYADFVTAMMAFFMVMWLVNSAEVATKQNIASYFRRPGLFEAGSGTPLQMGASGILEDGLVPTQKSERKNRYASGNLNITQKKKSGTDDGDLDKYITRRGQPSKGIVKGSENTMGFGVTEATEKVIYGKQPKEVELDKIVKSVKRDIEAFPEIQERLGSVEVKVVGRTLNIEIMDTDNASMFASGSATILPETEAAFLKIGELLNKYTEEFDIVGHTDGKPYSLKYNHYTNWELSADRANAARKLLEKSGVDPVRISSVLGRADRELKVPDDPLAAANRRITIRMQLPKPTEQEHSQPSDALVAQEQGDLTGVTRNVSLISPGEILELQKQKEGPIELPEAQNPQLINPAYIQEDSIFHDQPVFGPIQPFVSF